MNIRQQLHWKTTAEHNYILNLDHSFNPIDKGVNVEFKELTFYGGEPHFQITSEISGDNARLIITQRYNDIGDLFKIILANDAARRLGVNDIHLVLPYFPAARQDRVCNEGEPLTVKVFADLINGCGFSSVTIFTPHSEVTPALLNNVHVIDELPYILDIVKKNLNGHYFNVVCPDAGAGKRVGKIVQHLSNNIGYVQFNLIRCEKVRDVKDGTLKDFFAQVDDLGGHPTMIFDDILSMGGTFMGLGDKLKEKNAGDLMLYTAHADCVAGLQKMSDYFKKVFTSNSKKNWSSVLHSQYENVECFNITL